MAPPRLHAVASAPIAAARLAFSLLELVVVLGILMIVAGLLVPALAHSVSSAKLTADMAQLRQTAIVLSAYCSDYEDVFPISDEYRSPWVAAQRWMLPMLGGHYFQNLQEIDSNVDEDGHNFRIGMTMATVYDWRLMRPGHTVPTDSAVATAVRSHEVLFPSNKGLIFLAHNGLQPPDPGARSFCCTEPWLFPVAMTDASISTGTFKTFNGDRPIWEENGIGIPLATTWLGVHGVDKQ